MKSKIQLVSLLALLNLLGCQKSGQPTDAKNPEAVLQPKSQGTFTQGPSDGGGGDTCNGKMIESYKIDIVKLPEVQKHLSGLNKDNASFSNKESIVVDMSKFKNWYLIDCALDQIPQERKGLYLKTDQTAVHTGREIFIDSKLYSQMSSEEKAKLILHEVLMGIYLIKYMTIEELCKSSVDCSSSEDIEKMKNWTWLQPEPYKPLDDIDHQRIRNSTIWVWENKDLVNFKNQEFKKMLFLNGFDSRMTKPTQSKSSDKILTPASDIVRLIKKYNWTAQYPKYCDFDSLKLESHSNCSITADANIDNSKVDSSGYGKKLVIKLKINRERDHKVFEQSFQIYLNKNEEYESDTLHDGFHSFDYSMIFGLSNWPGMILDSTQLIEGHKSYNLSLTVYKDSAGNLQIMTIDFKTYLWYSFEKVVVDENGAQYEKMYGYSTQLKDESETIYNENRLPYSIDWNNADKVMLYQKIITK